MASEQEHCVVPFGSFFDGKRVLVTGDTGFKGSWLCEWLLMLGAEVHGIGLDPDTDPSIYHMLDLENRVEHHDVDIRLGGATAEAITNIQPDVVFHMAAQALVRRSYQLPLETIDTNVMGTANVLAAVQLSASRTGGPCAVVVVTSDKCYENTESGRAFRETDPMGGADIYSASKGAAELIAAAWQRSFLADGTVTMATCRAGNVVGGGDWAEDRIVPDSIRALLSGDSILIRNPDSTRPWQHVLEPLSGYLQVASSLGRDPEAASAWNFGPESDSNRTVRELADAVVTAWGSGNWHTSNTGAQPHEAKLLHLAIDKAADELDWRPVWDFPTTIARTVEWYKHATETDPAEFTRTQIDSYQRDAGVKGVRWATEP